MTTTASSFRVDSKVKTDAQKLAKKMGTNLSNVVNMYLTQFVREQRLNIVMRDEEGFTPEASAEILAALHDPDNEVTGTFDNLEDLFKHLDSLKHA